MHIHGVRHDDIKADNIMLLKHRSFIVDLNASSKMHEINYAGTLEFLSRRGERGELRNALDDWESFLYSMCELNKIDLAWFEEENSEKYGELKSKTNETIVCALLSYIILTFCSYFDIIICLLYISRRISKYRSIVSI